MSIINESLNSAQASIHILLVSVSLSPISVSLSLYIHPDTLTYTHKHTELFPQVIKTNYWKSFKTSLFHSQENNKYWLKII